MDKGKQFEHSKKHQEIINSYTLDSNHASEINNPCRKEEKMSYKCLDENNYNKDSCTQYFENYKACKMFWNSVVRKRKLEDIRPFLPHPDERETIKAEHMKTFQRNV
ncbi:coiled-coil-helix-coiled-coil-helix domain-containing protein 7 [Orussus abietinus]|uniref:coiled-coil-helix-coiled-coil-helix domain-containing protein 7 n=1 Tax=Orussus abietinus TaxID=222816 RepID=UPI00062521F1|nr:coiled-coil-helix-coiled-coil-helix domain-containing protein 7 [Orussus abietinus]